MSQFDDTEIDKVCAHIQKKGMPATKSACVLRRELRVCSREGRPSKRITWICALRDGRGPFLSDWKCVGLCSDQCIFKLANDKITASEQSKT